MLQSGWQCIFLNLSIILLVTNMSAIAREQLFSSRVKFNVVLSLCEFLLVFTLQS